MGLAVNTGFSYRLLKKRESRKILGRIKVKFKEDVMLPRIISREDIEHLLNYMHTCFKECGEEERFWLRDAAVVETFFATGARVYEISNIAEMV